MNAYVTAAQFAAALGISVRQLTRRIEKGKVPPAPRQGGEGWRRWPANVAAQVLRAGGYPVPEGWETPQAVTSGAAA